ncbi:MAG: DUF4384 domain-containing protein [Alphaproteobacteria bacterium]|nr:DUF4384 domain-containing protein [Alphaproteobacteria bacterium]
MDVLSERVWSVMTSLSKHFLGYLALFASALLPCHTVKAQSATIEVTTEKGSTPVYEPGDVMQVQVRVVNDTNLYCFYRQADGQVFRIFPNRYASNPRVSGGLQLQIPDSSMGFRFRFSTPLSLEAVRCYSSPSNLLQRLPEQIAALELSPLPGTSLADIENYLTNNPGEGFSSASVVIAVSGR